MRTKVLQLVLAVVAVISPLGFLGSTAHAATRPPVLAQFTSPVVGAPNVGMTRPFQWTASSDASEYYLGIGTSPGNGNVFSAFVPAPQTSLAIPPLPEGQTLWAVVWTQVVGQGWYPSQAASFTMAAASFVNPVVGSSNIGMTGAFSWTPAVSASMYYLGIGTSPGNADVYSAFVPASQTSLSPPALPVGKTLWARIWSEVPGVGFYYATDVSFSVAAS